MKKNNKPHQESIIDQPSMTSVVTKEYLVLPFSDTIIHKHFFQFWTIFTFVGTSILWAIGLWTDWYQLFLHEILLSMMEFWYVWAGFSIGFVFIVILNRRR